jgi:hypothetical protein
MMRKALTAPLPAGRRGILGVALLLACAMTSGCNLALLPFYLFRPEDDDKKTVEAEYKGLDNHSLAIVVFADNKVRYEYPTGREHVARAIAFEFGKEEPRDKIKKLRVVDPGGVLGYQERNIHWDEMDKTQLGKVLGADLVLFVTLVEFTTREPQSVGLLRGVVTADVAIYQTSLPERESRVWQGEEIRVVYPEGDSLGIQGADDRKIRQETVARFAQKVVWKFYQHKEKEKEAGAP